MSDDDRFLEDDDQESIDDVEVGKKVGILPAFVIKILQIVAFSIAGIVLVITIAVVTYNIMSRGTTGQTPQVISPELKDNKEKYTFFTAIPTIRGQTIDDPPKTFMADLTIAYEEGNKIIQSELTDRINQIRNLILKYLANKTADELGARRLEFLETDLMHRINNIMIEKIKAVLFTELQTF